MNFKYFLIIDELEKSLEELQKEAAIYSINPETGKTWRRSKSDKKQQLQAIIKKQEEDGVNLDDIWITFSDVPKLGIYPMADDGGTPLGIYAYPAKYVLSKLEQGDNVEFAYDRLYMIIFKVKRDNLLTINQDKEIESLEKFLETFSEDNIYELRKMTDKIYEKIQRIIKMIVKEPKEYEGVSNHGFGLNRFLTAKLESSYYSTVDKLEQESTLGQINEKIESSFMNINSPTKFWFESSMSKKEILTKFIKDIDIIYYEKADSDYYSTWKQIDSERMYKSIDEDNETAEVSDKAWEFLERIKENSKNTYDQDDEENKIYEGRYPFKKTHTFNEIFSNAVYTEHNFNRRQIKIKYMGTYFDSVADVHEYYFSSMIRESFPKIEPLIRKITDKLKTEIDNFINAKNNLMEKSDFPYKEQLMAEASKQGVNWADALIHTVEQIKKNIRSQYSSTKSEMKKKYSMNKATFIYYFTKTIAEKSTKQSEKSSFERGRSYYTWTKILRNLGISGMSDEHGSGLIHTNEPTQGVFFQNSNLQLITTIVNNPERMSSLGSRGATAVWQYPKHQRNAPSNRNPVDWDEKHNAYEIRFLAFQQKTSALSGEIADLRSNGTSWNPGRLKDKIINSVITDAPDTLATGLKASLAGYAVENHLKFLKNFTVLLKTYLVEKRKYGSQVRSTIKHEIEYNFKSIMATIFSNQKFITSHINGSIEDENSMWNKENVEKFKQKPKGAQIINIYNNLSKSLLRILGLSESSLPNDRIGILNKIDDISLDHSREVTKKIKPGHMLVRSNSKTQSSEASPPSPETYIW